MRIFEHLRSLKNYGVHCKLFNKWEDKIEDYDVYHLFKVTKESYNEVLYAKQKNKKVVVSAVIPIDNKFSIKISLLLASVLKFNLPHEFIRKVLRLSDIVTTQTEEERFFISRNYKIDIDKIVVIPNGVSERFLKTEPLKVSFKERFNISKPFILQVGRIDSNKNQIKLIQALKGLDIPVVFVGGADLNEISYFNRCKNELGSNMLMTDWIDHNSDLVISAFREAKLFVLPSFYETFGNVLIEAGVSGSNIACSKTLPINEYSISRYWTTFDPEDISSIKSAVLKEFERTYNHEMKKDFISIFSWDSIIKQYIAIYKALLDR